jgi:mannose-6-phosphate isomerase-like protein (cupin superfamily)
MKRKISICVKHILWYTRMFLVTRYFSGPAMHNRSSGAVRRFTISLLFLFTTLGLPAQEWKVDPTWLHRYVPGIAPKSDSAFPSCHYQPIFGEGDSENRSLYTVTRFAEVTVDPHGACQSAQYEHQEEIYFVLKGKAELHYAEKTYVLRTNDFTYLPPGLTHSVANNSDQELRALVMGFKIPSSVSITPPSKDPTIVNLDNVKEETVEGHPTSVLYKLLLGPRSGKRDAIDDAYVVNSFFWMDFAPGGTNFPHHHETAEEIYLVIDGEGEMVAGSGMDGIEGRYEAKAGDAYYFRPNCTVGFYNQNKPGAKAHILAVRARIPLSAEVD